MSSKKTSTQSWSNLDQSTEKGQQNSCLHFHGPLETMFFDSVELVIDSRAQLKSGPFYHGLSHLSFYRTVSLKNANNKGYYVIGSIYDRHFR